MTNKNKINSILDMMDDLQENLLALSDDMLLSIDSHDNESIKRPYGFVLQDSAYKGIKTWKHLYMLVLDYLCKKDKILFQSLPTEKKFKNIAALLTHFEIPPNQIRIYLREDRDA